MKYIMSLFCLSIAFVQFGCSKNDTETIGTNAAVSAKIFNLPYGSDPKQQFDIYLPANRSSSTTKLMIMIHGGGWTLGDKTDFTDYIVTLQNMLPDYAVVNINYRLASGIYNRFPTQENDIKTAIDFIYANRGTYHYSDKFVLLGASAGAHLALLQAYKYNSPVKAKAVVDFFGPTDMVQMYNNPAPFAPRDSIASVMGATPAVNPALYSSSSPINYVNAQSPPTIILQGGADILVQPTQSSTLRDKLTLNAVINQYVFYPTENHGWVGANLSDSFDKIKAFLTANVQ
ncbi:MAG: hypothetical protein JWQ27_1172 [Ferruginibacter sp.]|nr:hypothetical protein [Ferruginibacter sp.]